MVKRTILAMLMLLPAAAWAGAMTSSCDELDDGRRIRVVKDDGWKMEGEFAGCGGDSLHLISLGRRHAVALDRVALLQARKRSADKGLVYGAIAGSSLTAAMGLAMATDDFFDVDTGEVAAWTFASAVLGGVTGSALGSLFHRWETLYGDGGNAPDFPSPPPVETPEIGGIASPPDPGAIPAPPTLDDAVAELREGQPLRLVLRDGSVAAGNLAGWDGRRLHLIHDGASETLDAIDIEALWSRERRVRGGATSGAVLGAVGGGAFMGLMAAVLNGMSADDAPYLPMIAGGLIAGGIGGGAVGAGVGAALPAWRLRYGPPEAEEEGPPSGPQPAGGPAENIGAFSLMAGAAWNIGLPHEHADFAARIGLEARSGDRFSYGFELGRYAAGPALRQFGPQEPLDVSGTIWHGGAVARLSPLSGPVRPYLVVGSGLYVWDDTFLGASIGAGVRLRINDKASWLCEYRYHTNVQRLTETDPELGTVMAGMSWSW